MLLLQRSNVLFMATIKFLLRSKSKAAPIYCRLSAGRAITPMAKTGLTCSPSKWSANKGLPIGRDEAGKSLINDLNQLSVAIFETLNKAQTKGEIIDKNWLEGAINEHFNRTPVRDLEYLTNYAAHFIEQLPTKVSDRGSLGVKTSTVKKYKTILGKLEEFETSQGKKYLLKEVDLNFRSVFLDYLIKVNNLSENTAGRYIRFVKSFVLDAQKNGFECSPLIGGFKGFSVKSEKVTLTFAELEKIKNAYFNNERLAAARDWLIIGCYTGQRVSDLLRMNSGLLVNYGRVQLISIAQQKTGKTVQIPLHNEVKRILESRKGEFPPVFAKQQDSNSALFNRYLKQVCKTAGIDEPTKGARKDPETNRNAKGVYPKYELVTSHICRRSFATNFYGESNYPTPILMNITGHSSERQFLEYIGKPPLDYSLQLAEIWAKENSALTQGQTLRKVE